MIIIIYNFLKCCWKAQEGLMGLKGEISRNFNWATILPLCGSISALDQQKTLLFCRKAPLGTQWLSSKLISAMNQVLFIFSNNIKTLQQKGEATRPKK